MEPKETALQWDVDEALTEIQTNIKSSDSAEGDSGNSGSIKSSSCGGSEVIIECESIQPATIENQPTISHEELLLMKHLENIETAPLKSDENKTMGEDKTKTAISMSEGYREMFKEFLTDSNESRSTDERTICSLYMKDSAVKESELKHDEATEISEPQEHETSSVQSGTNGKKIFN
jgi:hypothetical protein